MKYSKEAYDYIEGEHIRLLIKEEGNERPPTINERVLEAFDAGRKSVSKTYSNLDCFASEHGKINFPRVTTL
jgi:hypothetical protein